MRIARLCSLLCHPDDAFNLPGMNYKYQFQRTKYAAYWPNLQIIVESRAMSAIIGLLAADSSRSKS